MSSNKEQLPKRAVTRLFCIKCFFSVHGKIGEKYDEAVQKNLAPPHTINFYKKFPQISSKSIARIAVLFLQNVVAVKCLHTINIGRDKDVNIK